MIKVIAFDFDCTMYVGDNGSISEYQKGLFVDCFAKEIYKDFVQRFKIDKKDIKDVIEDCKREGLDYQKLADAFTEHGFVHKIKDKLQLLPNEFYQELSKKCNLYVVSMSGQKYLSKYIDLYDIDKTCFKDVLSMDLLNHASKADLLNNILQQEDIKPQEMLMIGDSFAHDVCPAQSLGVNTLHFKGNFNQIYDYLSAGNICDCQEFKNKTKFIYK